MAISLKGLWAQVTGNPRNAGAQVAEVLDQHVVQGWLNNYYLVQQLAELDAKKLFDDDGGVLALANHADTALVFGVLAARPTAQLLSALAPVVLDPEPLRKEARPAVRALYQRAVLEAPNDVPADARAFAEQLRRAAGHGLPEARWPSPWAAPKKKRAKAAVPEVPKTVETFHDVPVTSALDPAAGGAIDQEAVARWRVGEHVVNLASHLESMARPTALGYWKSTPPARLYVWGDELTRLVPGSGSKCCRSRLRWCAPTRTG